MRYAKRIIAFLVLSAILLCIPLFSVSAIDDNSFIPYFPLSDDFIRPADSNSIVYDVHYNNDIVDRIVFPADANVLAGMNDSGGMSFIWACPNFSEEDVLFRYRLYVGSSEFTFLDKIAPTKIGDAYLGTFYTVNSVVSYVTNNQIFSGDDFIVEQNGVSVAFPNSQLQEEKKTQNMISQLISDIKDWFSNLIDSMGNFFTELANKISGFFTELGDKIGGFFTTLWNKIWWGNEEGESEYQPPDVGSKFDEVITSLNDWLSQLKGFSDTVDSQGDEVAVYISTGSDFATKFLTYAPAPILIFLTFGIVFVVVRKVVGR